MAFCGRGPGVAANYAGPISIQYASTAVALTILIECRSEQMVNARSRKDYKVAPSWQPVALWVRAWGRSERREGDIYKEGYDWKEGEFSVDRRYFRTRSARPGTSATEVAVKYHPSLGLVAAISPPTDSTQAAGSGSHRRGVSGSPVRSRAYVGRKSRRKS
jgi:hypothetical protein